MAARAVALGRAGVGFGLGELARLLAQPSMHVRRLAASAIGKLAGVADSQRAVNILLPVLRDPHPQVRQYAIKALAAYGAAAQKALHDLQDIAAALHEKDYNKRDALKTIQLIEEACRLQQEQSVQRCQRCRTPVTADEYVRSHKAFQRIFCDKCFDEVYLERRNFDTKVELSKTIRIKDGTLVQSDGERIIAEYLTEMRINYRYDERFRIIEGYAIRPDFYLPEFDVYIEYWGMDTADYKIGMLKKQKLYQQEGKKLVSLHFSEKHKLKEMLKEKLNRYVILPDVDITK